MVHVSAARIKETSVTVGTATYVLNGAVVNHDAFSVRMANNDTAYYIAIDQAGAGWEFGLGTWTTGNNLERTTVKQSTNSDAAVNWAAGTRDILLFWPPIPAEQQISADLVHATVADYRSNTTNTRMLESNVVWDALAEVALTSTSNLTAWDMSLGIDFKIDTLAENTTISNPTLTTDGKKGRLRIVQDAGGSNSIAWGTSFEFEGGKVPRESRGANSEDVFYYDVISSTRIIINALLNVQS